MTASRPTHTKKISNEPWWHIAGLLAGLGFAVMLMYARLSPDALDDIDSIVTPHLAILQSFSLAEIFLAITVLGSVTGIIVVTLGTIFFLRHSRPSIVRLVLLLAASAISMEAAKTFVERARPDVLAWLNPLSSYSFPSGHATLSMALYGFIAVSLYRRANTAAAKAAAVFVPSVIILLVGLSRIVLSFHYFTDVVAGFLLGFFWLCVIFMAPRWLSKIGT